MNKPAADCSSFTGRSQACSCNPSDTCSCASSGYSTGSTRSSNSSVNGDFSSASDLLGDKSKISSTVGNANDLLPNVQHARDLSNSVARLTESIGRVVIKSNDHVYEVEPGGQTDNESDSEEDDPEEEEESEQSSDSDVDSFDCSNWTVENLLELPLWTDTLKPMCFDSIESFDRFRHRLQTIVQSQMLQHNYNTFSSFNFFCNQFALAKAEQPDLQFDVFFRSFQSRILPDALSCVGLSMFLLNEIHRQLLEEYPDLPVALGPVSCEEFVKDVGSYILESANALKEHVLLAICIRLNGRDGYILLDPGYHVRVPVVVMQDSLSPHTSWFVQSESEASQKSFCYQLVANQLVTWTVRENVIAKTDEKRNQRKEISNLIHVKQLFANSINICEKRSYLYSFKSYVIRNKFGSIAGFYCYLRTFQITFFYPDERTCRKVQKKYSVDQLLNEEMQADIHRIAKWMPNKANCVNDLLQILADFQQVLADTELIKQMIAIDQWIEEEL